MNSIIDTIQPKSDQTNADSLVGGPITIKITNVSLIKADQPCVISYEGDNGKPYKPCLSMRRVLVKVWGDDVKQYVGRRLTIYNEPTVTYGGAAVGGIRISHMSDIEQPVTMALTATRANRKPFTVRPLVVANTVDMSALTAEARKAAGNGVAAYQVFWQSLSKRHRESLLSQHDGLKLMAAAADEASPKGAEGGDDPSTVSEVETVT